MDVNNLPRFRWNWKEFCGSENFTIWTDTHDDLSQCFQILCLQIPVLVLVAIISAFYAGKYEGWTFRTIREKYVINARLWVVLILALLPVARIIILVYYCVKALHVVNYFFEILESFTWFVHFSYVANLKHKLGSSLRGPVVLSSFYAMFYVICLIRAKSIYFNYRSNGSSEDLIMLVFALLTLLLQTLYGLTLIPLEDPPSRRAEIDTIDQNDLMYSSQMNQYYRFREDFDHHYLGTAMEGSGFIAKLLFLWVNPLIKKGVDCQIGEPEDVFDLPEELTCAMLNDKLSKVMNNRNDDSLVKGLHECFGKEFYGVGILKFISDLAGFVSPLLLRELMNFIDDPNRPVAHGYLYGIGILLASLIGSFCSVHYDFYIGKISLKLRGSLIARIYWKILYLNASTFRKTKVGEIVNYMSTDMERISNSCVDFHSVWSTPFQVIVTLYLLYTQVGLAFLAGVIFSIVLIPINKVITVKIINLTTRMMDEKDKRVELTSEVLRGIRVIKLHIWEEYFVSKILGIRTEELKYLKARKYLDALCVYFWASTPVMISVLTFSVYAYYGGELDAATIFPCLALLNMLIRPLNAFPWMLNGIMAAWVSVKRVNSFLRLDEVNICEYTPKLDESAGVMIKDGLFSWTLDNWIEIDLSVPKNYLVGIVGHVGSGKSSLIAAILGEINGIRGFVSVDDVENGIGYVSQVAWIQQCSVKDNILFGKPYDAAKYRNVVNACALKEDFDSWPNGDLEIVGEGGSTLSGGQKSRIALARAVYQDKSVYVMDGVLSSLDNQVAMHIYYECITKLLANKTRILVTHFKSLLKNANWIVMMESERIVKQGPPSEVLSREEDVEEINDWLMSNVSNLDMDEPAAVRVTASNDKREIEKEQREIGVVSINVYLTYCKAVGYILAIMIVVSILIMQISRHAVDWWISLWVSVNTDAAANNTNFHYLTGFELAMMEARTNDVKYFLTVYVTLGAVNSLIVIVRAFLFAYGGIRAAKRIHHSLLTSIMQAHVEFFDVSPLGRILNRFSSDTNTVDDTLPFDLNILLSQLVAVVGSVCMTMYGIPWLCLFLAPLVPMYMNIQNRYRLTSRELKRLGSITLSPLYSHVSETIAGITTIRALKSSPRFIRDNEDKVDIMQKCSFSSLAASVWLGIRLRIIGVLVIGGVCMIAAVQRHFDIVHSGFVGLAISYALTLTGSLGDVVNIFAEAEQKMVAMERIDEYMRKPKADLQTCKNEIILPFAWPSQGVVSFINVSLKYRDDVAYSLKDVSFETHSSEKIGIVGRTGAGKSSIFALLSRMADITEGTICIDAINIANVPQQKLRSKISVIPQDPFIFAGTIRDNIDPLKEYDDYQVWEAIDKCSLKTMLSRMGGYNGLLKSGGSNISAGERQLLCLVRAVLRNSKVVCIDEATSNVDQDTDSKIQTVLRNSLKQSTVLIIAHRLQTIRDCDRILVVGHGEILEFDSPETLLQNRSSYCNQLFQQNSNN